ncbi:DUF2809 domain-containing protein [Microbacterium ureisolvens]|uniref:DUF2809 domain-containing protein n=1 Tax=Microbacterium ureisolvens TaxID=2781186 RepID=UPI00363E376B
MTDDRTVGVVGASATARPRLIARRLIAGLLLLSIIAAGLVVHTTLPDTPASDIAGDALYAIAAYLAVVIIAPRAPALAAGGIAAAWCMAVELFQLTGLPLEWGAVFSPVMLVLGTVFDPRDLVVYVATVAVATGVDAALTAGLRRR